MTLQEPRFVNRGQLRIAGLGIHYTVQNPEDFARQWERFAPSLGKVPGQVGSDAYGVVIGSFGGHEGFEYITGVEVSSFNNVPENFRRLTIPAQRYAVFLHEGHVSGIREMVFSIRKEWLPKWMAPGSGAAAGAEQPEFLERYDREFDPKTGSGKIEIWVPLTR